MKRPLSLPIVMSKDKVLKVRRPAQGHTARERQSRNANPDLCILLHDAVCVGEYSEHLGMTAHSINSQLAVLVPGSI